MSDAHTPLNLDGFEALDAGARSEAVSRDPRGAAAALVTLGDDCERAAAGAPDRALRIGVMLAETARGLGLGSAEARALRATIAALAYMGRLDEALTRADEARAAADRAGDAVEHARAGVASMHALAKLGRTADAIERGRSAREALGRANRADLAARADLNLANVHKIRGEHAEALACLEQALAGVPESEAAARGTIENTLGETLLQLDRIAEAHQAFDRAAGLLSSLPLAHAVVVGNRADLFAREGRFGEALREFDRAKHLVAGMAPGHEARLRLEEAEALGILGAYGEAIAAVDAAFSRAASKGLKAEMARGMLVRARALLAADRTQEASADAARAMALAGEIGDQRGLRAASLVSSEIALRLGDASRSAEYAATAMRDASPLESANALVRTARAELALGNTDRAIDVARSARAGASTLGVRTVEIDAALVEADAERASGRVGASIDALRHALGLAEDLRGSIAADGLRAAFSASRLRVYEDLTLDLLARGDDASLSEAFITVERARSRVLLDKVLGSIDRSTASDGAGDAATTARRAEIARLRARLSALHTGVARDASGPGERRGVSPALLGELRTTEEALDRLLVQEQSARGVASLFAQPLPTAEVVARLGTDDAMIAYFMAGEELMAFVASKGIIASVRCLGHASEVAPLVDKLLYQLRSGVRSADARSHRAIKVLSRALHDMLVAPVIEQMPSVAEAGRLIVVPFGPLHALPFAALHDGDRYLIERFEIHTAPSASIACAPGRSRVVENQKPLVIAFADEQAPLIEEEARRLVAEGGADLLGGAGATAATVRTAVRGRSMLHFACHGRFIGALPNASGLRLADGWMPVREIVDLDLDARVVFLAGCETGRHAIDSGDELAGISRAFLAAGAECLVAGLWSVRDQAALEVSMAFHRSFSAGCRPSSALRDAVLASLRKWEHPSWWAPFVVTGSVS